MKILSIIVMILISLTGCTKIKEKKYDTRFAFTAYDKKEKVHYIGYYDNGKVVEIARNVKGSKEGNRGIVFLPNGKELSFRRGNNFLIYNKETKKEREIDFLRNRDIYIYIYIYDSIIIALESGKNNEGNLYKELVIYNISDKTRKQLGRWMFNDYYILDLKVAPNKKYALMMLSPKNEKANKIVYYDIEKDILKELDINIDISEIRFFKDSNKFLTSGSPPERRHPFAFKDFTIYDWEKQTYEQITFDGTEKRQLDILPGEKKVCYRISGQDDFNILDLKTKKITLLKNEFGIKFKIGKLFEVNFWHGYDEGGLKEIEIEPKSNKLLYTIIGIILLIIISVTSAKKIKENKEREARHKRYREQFQKKRK